MTGIEGYKRPQRLEAPHDDRRGSGGAAGGPPHEGKIYNWQYLTRAYPLRELFQVFPEPRSAKTDAPVIRQAKDNIRRLLVPAEQETLTIMRTQPETVRGWLTEFHQQEQQQTGRAYTPAELSAHYIIEKVYGKQQQLALAYFDKGFLPDFVFWHDVSTGVYSAVGGVLLAEEERRGKLDQLSVAGLSKHEQLTGVAKSPTEFAEEYLVLRAEAKELVHLLHEDTTGYTTIERVVSKIKQEVDDPDAPQHYYRIIPFQMPQYVLAGAQYGERVYHALYPHAQQSCL